MQNFWPLFRVFLYYLRRFAPLNLYTVILLPVLLFKQNHTISCRTSFVKILDGGSTDGSWEITCIMLFVTLDFCYG